MSNPISPPLCFFLFPFFPVAFWLNVVWGRTLLPLRPGTSPLRFDRVWKSCSTGIRPPSIPRSGCHNSRIRSRCRAGVINPLLLPTELFLTCDAFVLMVRMQSVQVQQLLLWPPGSKPMYSTPTSERGLSHWRESRLGSWSRNTQTQIYLISSTQPPNWS